MEGTNSFTSLIPWSWLWRRGIVLLLVGVVVFSLFFNDSAPPRDPPILKSLDLPTDVNAAERDDKRENLTAASPGTMNLSGTTRNKEHISCPPCPTEMPCSGDSGVLSDLLVSNTPQNSVVESSKTHATSEPLLDIEYRRRLADTLASVQRQIARVAGRQAVVDSKWVLTLEALVEELDPRNFIRTNSSRDFSARRLYIDPSHSALNNTRHVCPEIYKGRRYDHPYFQHGMEAENCTNVPNLSQVLTIVLPAQTWPPDTFSFVVSEIKRIYDVPIIALVSNSTLPNFRDKSIKVLVARKNYSDATLLNGLMKLVKTPYVFLGTSLAHFSNQSSLERLVRVLDELEYVKVAGGAARDLQGHWIHGCLQQHTANYRATYSEGYYHSTYECMYCDDLLTPFITSRKLIHHIPFSDGLNGPAVYRDWFAKVREAGHLAVVCPDVMFFTSNHVAMNSSDWLLLARRWALQTVQSHTGDTYSFSCESVGIKCDNVRFITKSFILPPCCVSAAHRDIGLLMDFAESQGLEYELQAGSVLGAVKFGSFLPWDTDHDIYVECKDFKTWIHQFSVFAKSYNCTPKVKYKNSFLKILCPSFTLDIFCRNQLSKKFLPNEYQSTPTVIWYGGRWTRVMSNPGLFSRNSMGFGILKHVQHSTHFTDTDRAHGYARPGTWLPCKIPKHHSCLDRYPADGNLPFL